MLSFLLFSRRQHRVSFSRCARDLAPAVPCNRRISQSAGHHCSGTFQSTCRGKSCARTEVAGFQVTRMPVLGDPQGQEKRRLVISRGMGCDDVDE